MGMKVLTGAETEHIIAKLQGTTGLIARSLVEGMPFMVPRQLGQLMRNEIIRAVKEGDLPDFVWEEGPRGRVYYAQNSIVPVPFDEMVASNVVTVFWRGLSDSEFNDLLGNLINYSEGQGGQFTYGLS